MHFTTLATSLAFGTTGWAAYTLQDDYFAGGNFFNEFSFWDSEDPTHGFVQYQNEGNATDMGLIGTSDGNIKMMADSTQSSSSGRAAVRITSNKSYQSGLIIADIDHMPGGICGTWPAFWTVGPDWPMQGEIDIVEGVNNDDTNKYTLHSGPSCSISQSGGTGQSKAFSGTVDTSNCDVSSGDDNTGCGITTSDKQTYGSGFNSNKGGVFATEWTTSGISVYFFPRGSIPSDIDSGSPNPSSWGMPQAHFQGGCDFAKSFTNQQIVFTNTFCGDWAGEVWSGSSCAASTGASTCEEYVQNNPEAFKDAYWSVNALKVYQNNGGSSDEPASSAAPSAPAYSASASVPVSSWAAPEPTASASQSQWTPQPSASASQPGWAPIVSDSAVIPEPTSAPAPAPSSPAEDQSWGAPSQTWGGNPWQSGSPWGEQREDDDGGWSVGHPAMERRHARHLMQHKRHAAGRFA